MLTVNQQSGQNERVIFNSKLYCTVDYSVGFFGIFKYLFPMDSTAGNNSVKTVASDSVFEGMICLAPARVNFAAESPKATNYKLRPSYVP